MLSLALLAAAVIAGCGGLAGDGDSASGGDPGEIPFSTAEWPDTDFSEHSVGFDEFVSGGPPKDGIPSIDDPKFVGVADADRFLEEGEPVAVVELNGEARAYPLQIMIWHEIVNDEIGGDPIAVTYCPLCNSTVAFSREVEGKTPEFGTTGMLRRSDLVMYDRETESWWQQITAEAVVGELTGTKLDVISSQILSWKEFMRLHPDGQVLSRDTGSPRDYGQNPYVAYDSEGGPLIGLNGEPDRSLPPKERVSAVKTGDRSAVVYPFSRLKDEAPINDEVDGQQVVVFFDPEVSSALDAPTISGGRDVGASAVFAREVDGQTLDFEAGDDAGTFVDEQTGSTWEMSGRATSGGLEGTQLDQVPHDDQFWFALAAFFEDPDIRKK